MLLEVLTPFIIHLSLPSISPPVIITFPLMIFKLNYSTMSNYLNLKPKHFPLMVPSLLSLLTNKNPNMARNKSSPNRKVNHQHILLLLLILILVTNYLNLSPPIVHSLLANFHYVKYVAGLITRPSIVITK